MYNLRDNLKKLEKYNFENYYIFYDTQPISYTIAKILL